MHKLDCDAHQRNGGREKYDARPGVYVRIFLGKLAFLFQCFRRDVGMWHEYVALARRIVQVETREDIAENHVSFVSRRGHDTTKLMSIERGRT